MEEREQHADHEQGIQEAPQEAEERALILELVLRQRELAKEVDAPPVVTLHRARSFSTAGKRRRAPLSGWIIARMSEAATVEGRKRGQTLRVPSFFRREYTRGSLFQRDFRALQRHPERGTSSTRRAPHVEPPGKRCRPSPRRAIGIDMPDVRVRGTEQ